MARRGTLVIIISVMMLISASVSPINQVSDFAAVLSANTSGVLSNAGGRTANEQCAKTIPAWLGESEERYSILYLSNVTTTHSVAEHIAEQVDINNIASIVGYLSSFDNRYTGTQGSSSTTSYIRDFFRLNCSIQSVMCDNFTFNDRGSLIGASNIVARINASTQTERTILVTAHHDSIGYQYPFNVYSEGATGADDDASGVGAALETARVLSIFKEYLGYNVLFIIFGGEEGNKTLNPDHMCEGSAHWLFTNHTGVSELDDIMGAVNLDGVAYKNGGSVGIFYGESGSTIALNISTVASMLHIDAQDEGEPRPDTYLKTVRCSTEDNFDEALIPAITFSGHYANPYTHTNLDGLPYLDFGLARNVTKIVVSYIYLASGLMPKPEETFAEGWNQSIGANGRCQLTQLNYIDVCLDPGITDDYDLVLLEPSLNGAKTNQLVSIIRACYRQERKIPVLLLGGAGSGFFGALNLTRLECIARNLSLDDLVAYVGASITDVGSHPIFSSPNTVSFTFENSTHLGYTVLQRRQDSNTFYLMGSSTEACPELLPLSYTAYGSRLWSWLGVLYSDRWRCGPVGFIGVENASILTAVARNITENMVCWLLNYSTTISVARLSDRNPLVGSHVNVTVAARNPLTWQPNSSLKVNLKVVSPSGRLLIEEVLTTDGNGVASSSNMFIEEVGPYQAAISVNLRGQAGRETIVRFVADPRIIVQEGVHLISLVQGESTTVMLNITYVPPLSEKMILEIRGSALFSNVSLIETLEQGYNNITFLVTAKEIVRAGRHNLTFLALPATMDYVACRESISILITPAYEVSIVDTPDSMTQLTEARIVVQVKNHRSILVNCSLRVSSYKVALAGEVPITVLSGEILAVSIQLKEVSASPYSWGEGEIKVILIRNGAAVSESILFTIYVSINPINLASGYVLPTALPILLFLRQSKKMKAGQAAIGIFLGGYGLFVIGLALNQSLFMALPLSMLVLGSCAGASVVRYIYDPCLPRGYEWFFPSKRDSRATDFSARSWQSAELTSSSILCQFGFKVISRLRELCDAEKYREVVLAVYMLVLGTLSDSLATSQATMRQDDGVKVVSVKRPGNGGTLAGLLRQFKEQHIPVPYEEDLRALELLYLRYARLPRLVQGGSYRSAARKAAECSIGTVTMYLKWLQGRE